MIKPITPHQVIEAIKVKACREKTIEDINKAITKACNDMDTPNHGDTITIYVNLVHPVPHNITREYEEYGWKVNNSPDLLVLSYTL